MKVSGENFNAAGAGQGRAALVIWGAELGSWGGGGGEQAAPLHTGCLTAWWQEELLELYGGGCGEGGNVESVP